MLKRIVVWMLLLFASESFAQLGMSLMLNRSEFMQYEPILACVKVRNESGRALVFGNHPQLQGFLLFEVTDARGRLVPRRADKEISVNGLVLKPGETRNLVFQLTDYYNLENLGSYRIHAYITHSMLPNEYKSNDLKFMVEEGVPVWSRTVGIPNINNSAKEKVIQERTYQLRLLLEKNQKYYYLIVEDKQHVYAVVRLGRVVGQEPFKAEVDMLSRLHLLIPISPKISQYLTFELDGSNTANRYYRTERTIPTLIRDPQIGRVYVAGGVSARPGIDFKDPSEGKISARDLVTVGNDDSGDGSQLPSSIQIKTPAPLKDSGIVDLSGK